MKSLWEFITLSPTNIFVKCIVIYLLIGAIFGVIVAYAYLILALLRPDSYKKWTSYNSKNKKLPFYVTVICDCILMFIVVTTLWLYLIICKRGE